MRLNFIDRLPLHIRLDMANFGIKAEEPANLTITSTLTITIHPLSSNLWKIRVICYLYIYN